MKTLSTISECVAWRQQLHNSIGLVPTMGALHAGHISLVEKSKQICENTVVSIFVNPTQFNDKQDFKNYPITIENDLNLLKEHGIDAVFMPSSEEMFDSNHSFSVIENKLSKKLEGESRPGHFDGVCTIVSKLFNIISPSHAFFGQKDAQQLAIIQAMVRQLDYQVDIIPCSTVREKNGLAMSSRNKILSRTQKEDASHIYATLVEAKKLISQGEQKVCLIMQAMEKKISKIPDSKIDYISIANPKTLIEIENNIDSSVLISVAVFVGGVRLIDNIVC